MNKKNIDKKHYSLSVTFSLFILVMASLAILVAFNINSNEETRTVRDKIREVGYGKIETINPLILESSERVVDKTNVNIDLINEIKRVYNINVIYGDDTEYLTKTVSSKPIYNESEVNSMLLELINCLEKYPNNIFKEIELKDYTIEICLVDHFNNDNIALATRDSNNNFKVYISNIEKTEKVKKSIHHEFYHILEYYMKLEFDINTLYKNWNQFNPKDFKYQENIALLDTTYVYQMDKQGRNYFVSIYSKSSDKEDRAEVFADTMCAETKPDYYTDNIGAIKGKMNNICEAIKSSFYSVNYGTSIYWTRFF